MVILPLIYSISFDNSLMKKNMKQDFKSIIEEKLKIENNILKNIIEECERRLVVNNLGNKSKGQLDCKNLNYKNGTSTHSNSSEDSKLIIPETSNSNMNKLEDNSQKKDNNSKVVNKPPDAKSYFFYLL